MQKGNLLERNKDDYKPKASLKENLHEFNNKDLEQGF